MSLSLFNKKKEEPKKQTRHTKPLFFVLSVIILVVIVVTFVGAPILTRQSSGPRLVFGSYKGREISYSPGNYFARQQQMLAERLRQSEQQSENLEAQLYRTWRGAFDLTAFHMAILEGASSAGLDVSQNTIDRQMVQYPGFMVNGEFDEQTYQQTSSGEKYKLRQLFRENLIHDQYLEDMLEGVRQSSAELEFVHGLADPERKFRFAFFTYDMFPRSEIITYGETHSQRFTRAKLSVITIKTSKSDAENIRAQIADRTASFETLAKTQSKDIYADQGGDMGWKYFYELERDFPDPSVLSAVFNLAPGEVSNVLETSYGWVIYRLDQTPEEPDFTDEETIQTVREYMFSFERGLVEDYLRRQAESLVENAGGEAGFAGAATEAGVQVMNTDYFPINYGNVQFLNPVNAQELPELQNAAFREGFFEEAFSLEEGELSEPIILREGILLLELSDERSPDESTAEFLNYYYPVATKQFRAEDMERFFTNSDDLEDNFDDVFITQILGRGR